MIRMEDAGCAQARMFHYFLGVARRYGEEILERQAGAAARPAALRARATCWSTGRCKNCLGFSRMRVAYTAGEAIGPELFSFYRSLGINLKQLYGQTEAFLYITAQPDGEIYRRHRRAGRCRTWRSGSPTAARCCSSARACSSAISRTRPRPREAKTPDGWVQDRRRRLLRSKSGHLKIIDRAKDVGRLTDGTLFAPKYIENKLKFYPNIREAVAFGDGRDFVAVIINIDLDRGRQLGRAQQRGLRLLPGAGRPSAGLRHDREERRGAEPRAGRGAR